MASDESTAATAVVARDRRRVAARLWVVHPPELVGALPLDAAVVRIGRDAAESDVCLPHPTVSRLHLSVTWDATAARHVATDAQSKNGTWIGSARVARAPRVLGDGAVLRLGDTVLVYERGPGLAVDDEAAVSRDALPGESAAARLLRSSLARAGADPAPALLLGETGTGKEHLARELHRLSGRRGPFVAVSCAELSGELTESRLFGHARGAFTGAQTAQPGLFRSADGGTLLLDEIGELAPILQPKLLRVLQESAVLAVGETRPVPVDVRVIAATNRDLAPRVADGSFRRDLHARLAFWNIAVPPLRDRRADILAWVGRLHARFLERRAAAPRGKLSFTAEAVEALLLAPWRDNLRGLDQAILHLAGIDGVISPADVKAILAPPEEPGEEHEELAAARPAAPATREELEAALARLGGNVHALARHYQRDRRQIYRWLRAFGLRPSRES